MKTKQQFLTAVLFLCFLLTSVFCFPQGAAINTTGANAHSSAMLDISADNAGILIPRMTKSQKLLISSPAVGLMIYQTDDTTGFWYFNGNAWLQSIGTTGVTGPTGADGATGLTGAVGATGFLAAGSAAGNTPYWDGNQWVVNSSNIFNNGGSVGIGTNSPDASAALDITSNNAGLLIPRLTTTERNAINTPAEGLQIFNTDNKCFEYFVFGYWQSVNCGFNCGVDNLVDNRDANTYQTVEIGSKCWMKENLKYLPAIVGPGTGSIVIPYYYVFGYDGTNVVAAKAHSNYTTYGVLYNWLAAISACPIGWHLPSDTEWKQLEIFLNMSQTEADATGWRGTDEGGKLKQIGTSHWNSPNTGATNSSGFSALPGGRRYFNGSFDSFSYYGNFWLNSESGLNAWMRVLSYSSSTSGRYADNKLNGLSIRCVRD